jgi:hypothetical protein
LQQYFFLVDNVLCPPGTWKDVPTPDAVSSALKQAWDNVVPASDVSARERRVRARPAALEVISSAQQALTSGPSIRINNNLKRPSITFISGRTDDQRTPKIVDDMT